MELTVVGASGSISGPDSPASCYLVQAPWQGRAFSVLLDLGPGALGVLHHFLRPADLDAVLLSHLHADHCLDLCALYVEAVYSGPAPWPPIGVWGPRDTAERIGRAYASTSADGEGPAGYFGFHTWTAEQQIGPFRVSTALMQHPVEAYAIRLREQGSGATLVYSGDTGPCAELVELARGTDLLLCEASFEERPDNPPALHLTGRQAGRHAAQAAARLLVITHVPPWNDPVAALRDASAEFGGPVELARTGARWTLGSAAPVPPDATEPAG